MDPGITGPYGGKKALRSLVDRRKCNVRRSDQRKKLATLSSYEKEAADMSLLPVITPASLDFPSISLAKSIPSNVQTSLPTCLAPPINLLLSSPSPQALLVYFSNQRF